MIDLIVIGGGPAGLSAAITARARNKEVLVISNAASNNPLAASKVVKNYPGMPEATGLQILETMQTQAKNLGVSFLQARAISVVPLESGRSDEQATAPQTTFSVTTSNDFIEARQIILACGASGGGKPIQGELEFLGRGVSYCATCDGMLFRSSEVLVVGLSPEAVNEADFLASLGATVHYIAQTIPQSLDSRINRHVGKVLSIEGDAQGVTRVLISEYPGASDGSPKTTTQANTTLSENLVETKLNVRGVFVLRQSIAPASLLPSLKTENGYIKVDEGMRTSVKGVFAAGDCIGKPLQIAKAVGQGQIAVLSAVEH